MIRQRWQKVLAKLFCDEKLADEFKDFLDPPTEVDGKGDENDEAGNEETNEEVEAEETENEEEEDGSTEESDAEEEEETEADGDEASEEEEDEDSEPSEIELLKQEIAELKKVNDERNEEEVEEEPPPVGIFESDAFKNLTEALDWDDDETKAFKLFFESYAESTNNKALQEMRRTAPKLINQTISTQTNLTSMKEKFYSNHPKLNAIKPYVAQVASQIARQGKGKLSVEAVLDKTADIVYENMKIDRGTVSNKTEKGKKPAFPKAKGARKKAAKPTKLESQLSEMLALDE